MDIDRSVIKTLLSTLSDETKQAVEKTIAAIVAAKSKKGKVVVVTGSGPNVHEGVTTLIAELMHKDIIDGVTTSSAVIGHEMAGVLEEVKRVDGKKLGFTSDILPRGDTFEVTLMPEANLQEMATEMVIDKDLIARAMKMDGTVIIKAAGNMGYPLGLWTEKLAKEILYFSRSKSLPFETIAGAGADPRTMIGAGYQCGKPVLVTVPQLVGSGMVGIAIGDSISIMERSARIAGMLQEADVIIESAVVLTQEIHDGPFEIHTGHGIWSHWEGYPTYSLEGKTLIRIDLDPVLKQAWDFERQSSEVQKAIDSGGPKTKLMGIPFRMEMSGFTRLENSIPIIADIGVVWPIIAYRLEQELNFTLDFISYPQQTPEGQEMREWIVRNIRPIDRKKLCASL